MICNLSALSVVVAWQALGCSSGYHSLEECICHCGCAVKHGSCNVIEVAVNSPSLKCGIMQNLRFDLDSTIMFSV